MLLVGARALRRRWPVLAVLGMFWMALGLAIMVDASDGLSVVTVEAFAILLLFEGFLALALFTLAPRRRGHVVLLKALALILLGSMILDFPVQVDLENSLLFGLAFLIDGGARIATASVVRFPKWQVIAAGGVLEARPRRARARRLAGQPPPDRAVLHRRGAAAVRLDRPPPRPAPAAAHRRHAGGEPAGVRPARLA